MIKSACPPPTHTLTEQNVLKSYLPGVPLAGEGALLLDVRGEEDEAGLGEIGVF